MGETGGEPPADAAVAAVPAAAPEAVFVLFEVVGAGEPDAAAPVGAACEVGGSFEPPAVGAGAAPAAAAAGAVVVLVLGDATGPVLGDFAAALALAVAMAVADADAAVGEVALPDAGAAVLIAVVVLIAAAGVLWVCPAVAFAVGLFLVKAAAYEIGVFELRTGDGGAGFEAAPGAFDAVLPFAEPAGCFGVFFFLDLVAAVAAGAVAVDAAVESSVAEARAGAEAAAAVEAGAGDVLLFELIYC